MTKPSISPVLIAELSRLSQSELIERLLASQEETRLAKAFGQIADTGTTDAALMWRGRNRFLNEKIIPVQLEPSEADSFQAEQDDCGNRIIAGDNLPVMASLMTEFKGGRDRGVDIIYLDPPYNTGSDTFSYNDDYRFTPAEVKALKRKVRQTEKTVGIDDVSRHTKWINHIAPRLWQAKKLLKNTGVLIASIDEHELPRLWLLLEEMFGEKNRIATLIWERSRKNDANYISEGHEYMLVWAKDKAALDTQLRKKGKWRETKPGFQPFIDEFNRLRELYGQDYATISDGLRAFVRGIDKTSPLWTVRQYFRVDAKCDDLGPYKEEDPSWPGGGGPNYVVLHPKTNLPVRTPPKGWIVGSKEQFDKIVEDDLVVWKEQGTPKIKKYLLAGRDKDVVTSVIQKDARYSVMLAKSLMGFESAFLNPKDDQLLSRLFRVVTWGSPNAVVLDPYAGSGTTAHAILALNAEDGGKRRFILIENGDPNAAKQGKIADRSHYATGITAERVRRVISGKWADGKPHTSHAAGFQFFTATKEIDRAAIMTSDRETLADIILQVVEEESNRLDCRMDDDYKYLIGKTRTGYGIALIWEGVSEKNIQPLTDEIVDIIIDEARTANVTKPVFVYAVGNVATEDDTLYRFQHIPDSILARLNLLPGDEEDTE